MLLYNVLNVHDIACVRSGQRVPKVCPFFEILIIYYPYFM